MSVKSNQMTQDEVMAALQNGVTEYGGSLLMTDHLGQAKEQLTILEKRAEAVAANFEGGLSMPEATNAVYNLFGRLASALDSSVVFMFPDKPACKFEDFKDMSGSSLVDQAKKKALDPFFAAISKFTIPVEKAEKEALDPHCAAIGKSTIPISEKKPKVFTPTVFWNVIKHRRFGRVQAAVVEGAPTARLYIGTCFYDVVPAAQKWYTVVSAWIKEVQSHGVLVPVGQKKKVKEEEKKAKAAAAAAAGKVKQEEMKARAAAAAAAGKL